MNNEKLSSLDVFKYYDQKIKGQVEKNTNEYIDSLFVKSNYNRKLVDELSPKVANKLKQINQHFSVIWKKQIYVLLFFLLLVLVWLFLNV